MSGPGIKTDPRHADPSLRGRRYSIPYETVWEGIVSVLGRTARCRISESDDEAGLVRAEITRRLPKAVDDVEIRVGLDRDVQTWVSMSSVAREGRFDLGANERRVRAFFESLDREVGAVPGSILPPEMPASPPERPSGVGSEPPSGADSA